MADASGYGWKKGVSGNPKGRPPRIMTEIENLAKTYTRDAIETLARIMKNGRAPEAARVSAATHLLDRAWGKPKQAIDATVRQVQNAEELSDDELAAIIAGRGIGPLSPSKDSEQLH